MRFVYIVEVVSGKLSVCTLFEPFQRMLTESIKNNYVKNLIFNVAKATNIQNLQKKEDY